MTTSANPETTSVDPQNPWLGLASFTEETRQYFYGREEEVAELARRVQRKLLTVLFGQSGLGKTSILRAGIVPRLRPEGYCPVYVRIDYSPESPPPSDQIKQAIFRATESSGTWTQPGTAVTGESLWEFLHHRDDILRDAAGKPVIPLLIFDQFEEIFTLAQADDAGRKRAAQFIEDLADLVENRPPKELEARLENDDSIIERFDFGRADYRILIALREDYLAHLEGLKSAMPSITQNRMRLARMNGQQALAAVMKPGGKLVSQEVAEAIVRFTAGGSELPNAEVEPSLLSLICRELNNARIAQSRSEMSADLLAGSNETILNEFYERALADQPPAVRKVIEDHLLTESGYRENLAEERVLKAFTAAEAKPDAATTLATLVNRRLLRIEERLDVRRVELTHDVLCGVVKASREQRLEREALDEAEKKLITQKTRERATRKALIRARQIATACAVLAIGAVISAVFGYQSTKRAQRAEADAQKVRVMAEGSRGEAEKLVVYLLEDFYKELAPVGRLDVVGELAKSTVAYYKALPAELRTPETQRNHAFALMRSGEVLSRQGKNDDADLVISEANTIVTSLRGQGDTSEATTVALAAVRVAQANVAASRANEAVSIKLDREALELLKPVLAQPDPPIRAREIELNALGGVGFAQGTMRDAEAIPTLRHVQELARAQHALDMSNLSVTTTYVLSGWVLSQALLDQGKESESKGVAEDTVEVASRLLQLRPDHRLAMSSKAIALGILGQIESSNLRNVAALKRFLEAHVVEEARLALDTSRTSAWNNLAIRKSQIASTFFELGRVDESVKLQREIAAMPRKVKMDEFLARNFASFLADFSVFLQNLGEAGEAASNLAEARKASAKGQSGADTDYVTAEAVPVREAWILWLSGKFPDARQRAEQSLARLETVASKGNPPGQRYLEQAQAELFKIVGAASYAMGEFPAAETAFRQELLRRKKEPGRAPGDEAIIHECSTRLAMAIARQGRADEASALLQPAIKFHRQMQSRGSDDLPLRVSFSKSLLASALANPGERKANLAEAASLFDALPPSMRRWKEFAMLREEIAREMAKP